ncbi:hypothetical protein SEA_BIRDSONG_91 [Gordonia phage Birdsong]
MKIVTRQQLMAMPAGVLFAEARSPFVYGDLQIYGGKFGDNDFLTRSLVHESEDSGEFMDRGTEMWEHGTSYPVEAHYGRDGVFDDTIRYVVWEAADLKSILADIYPAAIRNEETQQ